MSKLRRLLPTEIKQLKFETQLNFDSSILDVLSQSFNWKHPVSFDMRFFFSRSTRFFANFTIEMIGNETGLLLEFVDLRTNESTKVKPSTCWKEILLLLYWKCGTKIFIPVKNYGKTNMTVFVLSLWQTYRWALTYFGQFINQMDM